MKRKVRRKLFVDTQVQGALLARAVLYWLFCVVAVCLIYLCWQIISSGPRPFWASVVESWNALSPVLLALLFVLPLIAWDSVRLSNRFAGPMFRLRRYMVQLSRGEPVPKVFFRPGDYWQDFDQAFNDVAERMEMLEQQAQQSSSAQHAR